MKVLLDNKILDNFISKYNLAVDNLTQNQLAEAIRQMISSGDFNRYVVSGSDKQSIVYLPWSGIDELRAKYNELLDAVEGKYPNESRHETALRYIREYETLSKDDFL